MWVLYKRVLFFWGRQPVAYDHCLPVSLVYCLPFQEVALADHGVGRWGGEIRAFSVHKLHPQLIDVRVLWETKDYFPSCRAIVAELNYTVVRHTDQCNETRKLWCQVAGKSRESPCDENEATAYSLSWRHNPSMEVKKIFTRDCQFGN